MILYFVIIYIYIFFFYTPMRRSLGQRRRISCLGQLSPPPPPLKKQERRTHTSRWRPSKSCARARAYVSTENRFSPYRSLRHERRRRFRLSKIAAVFFPPFDIVACGVVSAIPESKYSFLFCSCLPRLFYVVPMVFSQP